MKLNNLKEIRLKRGNKEMITRKIKRTQNSVIVNVLLIIIAIAAVAIVGAWIINFLNEKKQIDSIDINLSIDPVGTFYDTSSTESLGNLNSESNQVSTNYVKISMFSDSSKLSSLKLVFNSAGNSIICTTTHVPRQLESITYKYIAPKADFVEIVPVVSIGGKEKLLTVVAKSSINNVNRNINVVDSNVTSVTSCSSSGLPTGPGKINS